MLRQLKLQDRLVAMAAIPIVVVAVVAAGLLLFLDGGETTPYGIFALCGVVVSTAFAFAVGRSIQTSISDMAIATSELADAHRQFAAGEITAADLPQLNVDSEDDLARVAGSINAINAITAEAGESRHSEVKEGLSNIVVNLARRSQTLLDRQVEYLDKLEGSEEDPDRLGELFKVDHLATRMRRNAESLKVLAEADPGRRRGGPVEVGDVLRVAMGEVENYENIELTEIDEGQVDAGAAMDLAHLVAELMENATQFSPPQTPVAVSGEFDDKDRFVITIKDQGMGMPKEKLVEANAVLADPPELGLGMGRSLGFMVVGRLAQRMGATVTLALNGQSGTEAVVAVPNSMFKGRTEAPKAKTATRPEAPSPATAATSASPALEKLLGLSEESLDGPLAAVEKDEANEPVADWAANSPFSPDREDTASLPSRDVQDSSDEADEDTASEETTGSAEQEAAEDSGSTEDTAASEESETDDPEAEGSEAERSEATESQDDESTDVVAETDDDVEAEEAQDEEVEETWTPPEVTADAPPRIIDPPEKLTDAIPTGDAFDSGVDSLLSQDSDDPSEGLAKRQRGASQVPVGQSRPVAASSRDPEEIKSMLSRYRDGLKGGKKQAKNESADSNSGSDDESKDR